MLSLLIGADDPAAATDPRLQRNHNHKLGYVFEMAWGRVFGGRDAIALRAANLAEQTSSDWRVHTAQCVLFSLHPDHENEQEPCRLAAAEGACIPDQDLTKYDQYKLT
jgi:hypothetical protein